MALYPNGRHNTRLPYTQRCSAVTAAIGGASGGYSVLGASLGRRMNRFVSEQADPLWSTPSGYGVTSPFPARTPGGIAAPLAGVATIAATGTGILGMPAVGSSAISVSFATASGELIAFGNGAAAITVSISPATVYPLDDTPFSASGSAAVAVSLNSPSLLASVQGAGSAGLTVAPLSAVLGALADISGGAEISVSTNIPAIFPVDDTPFSLGGTAGFSVATNSPTPYPLNDTSPARLASAAIAFSGELIPYAIGNMIGTTDTSTELTPGQIADAVWSSQSADEIADIVAFLQKIVVNRREITSGKELLVYDDDGITPILRKALHDIYGNSIADLSSGVLAREEASSV